MNSNSVKNKKSSTNSELKGSAKQQPKSKYQNQFSVPSPGSFTGAGYSSSQTSIKTNVLSTKQIKNIQYRQELAKRKHYRDQSQAYISSPRNRNKLHENRTCDILSSPSKSSLLSSMSRKELKEKELTEKLIILQSLREKDQEV